MENMSEFPDRYLPQAYRALTFIRHQLSDLAQFCDCMLQDGQVNPEGFLELDNLLQKVLHETRAVCRPPPKTPTHSDFDVVSRLGSGNFGTVSHVRHKQTRQSFAVKEMKRDENQRYKVLMERDILTFLDHPLVVSMFCSFETERNQYMVMEYLGGGDFDYLLQCYNHLSLEASRFYAAELVLAVGYIHRFGILHRDLKPGNLLISSTGHLKVADFGLAKLGSVASAEDNADAEQVAREFSDGEKSGTPLYMAPELYLDTGYGKPIDWWAAGVIIFNLLTGSDPFSGVTMDDFIQQVVRGNIRWPEKRELLPYEARSLISHLLDTDPVRRLGSRGASEVRQHPFFQDVDWDEVMFATPPYACEPEDEDKTGSSQTSRPRVIQPFLHPRRFVEDQSGSPPGFCYVAHRFKEVYGDQKPLSADTLQKHFPKKQQHLEEWNEGVVEKKQQRYQWWE